MLLSVETKDEEFLSNHSWIFSLPKDDNQFLCTSFSRERLDCLLYARTNYHTIWLLARFGWSMCKSLKRETDHFIPHVSFDINLYSASGENLDVMCCHFDFQDT